MTYWNLFFSKLHFNLLQVSIFVLISLEITILPAFIRLILVLLHDLLIVLPLIEPTLLVFFLHIFHDILDLPLFRVLHWLLSLLLYLVICEWLLAFFELSLRLVSLSFIMVASIWVKVSPRLLEWIDWNGGHLRTLQSLFKRWFETKLLLLLGLMCA